MSALLALVLVGVTNGVGSRAELESFLDGVMVANLRDRHVAGATVAVVLDGKPFFAKGYGWADVEKRVPVDAERTLFRIGSISKLFTWTAVLQLVEEGELSLDADVNGYLDFEIPATFPAPITLRHVMTHTPGFEEDGRDLWARSTGEIVPLGGWLASHVPARVRPPGELASYSNYAAALAGYIVERASGMPWAERIEERVLAPLGMEHASVRQPLPERLLGDMSKGYESSAGQFLERDWEVVTGAAPAGAMSASAADMAKFMLAHLSGGSFGSGRILSEAGVERMHARAFAHDERLNGSALGFYEKSSHGLRIVGHGGSTRWFHSDLALIPSERLGLFVSYNTNTGHDLNRAAFLAQFLDHYYPSPPPAVALPPDARAQAERVAGEYAMLRRSYTTYQKVESLEGAITFEATDAGRLLMDSPFWQKELVPVGPMLWREAAGDELVAFRDDGHAFLGSIPVIALERIPWHESPGLHQAILLAAGIVFVLALACAARRALRRRLGRPLPEDVLPGRGLLLGAVLANLAFALAFAWISSDAMNLVTSPMTAFKIALALPVLGALLALASVAPAVAQWLAGAGTLGARLRYDATLVFALLFAWSLHVWNLLGWRM